MSTRTQWAQQLADQFGDEAARYATWFASTMVHPLQIDYMTVTAYHYARLAGHFGRLALGETVVVHPMMNPYEAYAAYPPHPSSRSERLKRKACAPLSRRVKQPRAPKA